MSFVRTPSNPILAGVLAIGFLPLMWPTLLVYMLCKIPALDAIEYKHPVPFKLVAFFGNLAWAVFLFTGGLG